MLDGSASTTARNIITVLAVDMAGSTRHIASCDPDDAQAFLDQWLDHIRAAVERAGGLIVHYAGDGGIAIFGWPSAFEDHADRACIAAWDIQQGHSNRRDREDFRFSSALEFIPDWLAYAKVLETPSLVSTSPVLRFTLQLNCSKRRQRQARSSISAETAKLCRSPLKLTALRGESAVIADHPIDVYRLDARPDIIHHNDVARRYRFPLVNGSTSLQLA